MRILDSHQHLLAGDWLLWFHFGLQVWSTMAWLSIGQLPPQKLVLASPEPSMRLT